MIPRVNTGFLSTINPSKSLRSRCNSTHFVLAISAITLASSLCMAQTTTPPEEEAQEKTAFTRKEIDGLIDQAIKELNKAKDVLRFVSVKLPDLITDNARFRTVDAALNLCREET